MFTTTRDIFQLQELRSRLFYTVFFAAIYRLGTHIILPGLNPVALIKSKIGVKAILDSLLGGSLNSYSVLALGITPYISASIMIQMASISIPYFQRLQKEGAAGRAKKNQIIRLLTLLITLVQSVPFLVEAIYNQKKALLVNKYYFFAVGILLIVAGTMFSLWLGDRITEKGVGNGTSVLIMVGIVSNLPGGIWREYENCSSQDYPTQFLLFFIVELLILFFITLLLIAFMQAKRKIYLQYARQMINSQQQIYQHNRPHLPIKVNGSGVMPIIFANLFLVGILMVARLLRERLEVASWLAKKLADQHTWEFNAAQAFLVFTGTFLYTAVFTNPVEIADDLKRNNGFIPGVKPGKPTSNYIDSIISKITLPGATFLAAIAMLPSGAIYFGITKEFSRFYGGTSMIILIGVILEIVQQIESYLFMRYYDRMIQGPNLLPST